MCVQVLATALPKSTFRKSLSSAKRNTPEASFVIVQPELVAADTNFSTITCSLDSELNLTQNSTVKSFVPKFGAVGTFTKLPAPLKLNAVPTRPTAKLVALERKPL